jgi:hypothetical protein
MKDSGWRIADESGGTPGVGIKVWMMKPQTSPAVADGFS